MNYEILETSDDYRRLITLNTEFDSVYDELMGMQDRALAPVEVLRYNYLFSEFERLKAGITRQREKLVQNRRDCGELRDPGGKR